MITWLFLSQTVMVLAVLAVLCEPKWRRRMATEPDACIAVSLALAFFAVPMVYALGWLLLPAWGVGSITTCLGRACG